MNETIQFVARHGYWLLIAAVLGRQACLPMPANLFLVAAGALGRSGRLSVSGTISLSVITFMLADLAWYEAGRRLGDRTLHFLCGLSENPESCVLKATASFAQHRVRTLLVSKFVVGLDAVAAPLAGSARMPAIQFLALDGLGALSWSSAFVALGYIFSNQLERVAAHLFRIGVFVTLTIAAAFVFHLMKRVARWQSFVHQFKLTRITPEELKDKLKDGEDILLLDLQGGQHDTTGPMAIPGAVRIDPRRLEQYSDAEIIPSQEVVLYCAGPGEFTSARVALALQRKGIQHVQPLAGGLSAWRDRGFPVTSEVRAPASHAVRG